MARGGRGPRLPGGSLPRSRLGKSCRNGCPEILARQGNGGQLLDPFRDRQAKILEVEADRAKFLPDLVFVCGAAAAMVEVEPVAEPSIVAVDGFRFAVEAPVCVPDFELPVDEFLGVVEALAEASEIGSQPALLRRRELCEPFGLFALPARLGLVLQGHRLLFEPLVAPLLRNCGRLSPGLPAEVDPLPSACRGEEQGFLDVVLAVVLADQPEGGVESTAAVVAGLDGPPVAEGPSALLQVQDDGPLLGAGLCGEELGGEVHAAERLMRYPVSYPGKIVWLDLWIVSSWSGELRGLDGQALKWVEPAQLGGEDILEADAPMVEALASGPGPAAGRRSPSI